MKSADVRAALRKKFFGQEWAIFFEVGDATGVSQRRYADAVAMNLWPSRGLEIHGMEIKVSRSDWLSELKNPAKSDPVQRYCDRWWIVCPEGIIKPGELPTTWGHYEVSQSGAIRQVVAAPKLEPVPVTRSFMASLMRRAGAIDQEEVQAMVDAEVSRRRQQDKQYIEREIESRTRDASAAMDEIKKIEAATGVKISRWSGSEDLTKAIKFVLETGVLGTYSGIAALRNSAEAFVKRCDEGLAKFQTEEQASKVA